MPGYDLLRTTETFVNIDNHDWLASAHGTEATDSITVSAASVLAAYPDGQVPAGVEVSRDAGTGLYALGAAGTPRGFLLHSVSVNPLSPKNVVGALLWHGEVIAARVPVPGGGAAPVAANHPQIRLV